MKKLPILALLFAAFPAFADNCANLPAPTTLAWNRLEVTPYMGWNSWYPLNTSPTEAALKTQADLLVSAGLKTAGYTLVSLDDGWASGRSGSAITANATNFPDGMAATFAYIHNDGLLAGIYSSPSQTTCGGFTGSGGFESADATTFASWGADYLKYDYCGTTFYASCWNTKGPQVWQMMAQDIRATGRPIALQLGTSDAVFDNMTAMSWGSGVGYNELYFPSINLASGGGTGWATLVGTYIPAAAGLYRFEKPGFFPQCDYLLGQTEPSGTATLTQVQSQTQMGLYALWGCPLQLGMDISTLSSPMLAIYENAGVIAVDQDALAHAAILYQQFTCGSSTCQVWVKPLKGGAWAMGLLNLDSASHTIAVNFGNFGGNPDVQDLWAATDLGTMTSYSVSVASNAIAMIKVTPAAGAAHTVTNMQLENMAIQ